MNARGRPFGAALRVTGVAVTLVATSSFALAQGGAGAPAPTPTTAVQPNPLGSPVTGPLSTNGANLVDANGQVVTLNGVNWFGMETDSFAPHGLDQRNYDDMLAEIAATGFNTVRLPFSDQFFQPGSTPQGIDYTKNPDLQGLSGLALLDKIVASAGRHGLSVILDRHRPSAAGQSALWYTDQVPESQWIDDWAMLAAHYRGNPTVIGADLHNEPHGAATWGDGNLATDWRLAAERAGDAIQAVNPDWLIIVQGIEQYNGDWYWWGGNLEGAAQFPVQLTLPNKLVYSAHDYGPGVYEQPWFTSPDFPNNLPGVWSSHWAYLIQQGIAPVFVGEFGGRSVGTDPEGVWQRTLLGFLQTNHISYAYWAWNPDSSDTGGLLNADWTTLDQAKAAMFQSSQAAALATPTPVQPTAVPTPPASAAVAAAAAPPGALYAPGGPFDADPQHQIQGVGGPNDPDPVHRAARAHDEELYLQSYGSPWQYAVYATGGAAQP